MVVNPVRLPPSPSPSWFRVLKRERRGVPPDKLTFSSGGSATARPPAGCDVQDADRRARDARAPSTRCSMRRRPAQRHARTRYQFITPLPVIDMMGSRHGQIAGVAVTGRRGCRDCGRATSRRGRVSRPDTRTGSASGETGKPRGGSSSSRTPRSQQGRWRKQQVRRRRSPS